MSHEYLWWIRACCVAPDAAPKIANVMEYVKPEIWLFHSGIVYCGSNGFHQHINLEQGF